MDFLNNIDACNLQDLGYSNPIFTWSNNRPVPDNIEERLDQALANPEWQQLWKFLSVFHRSRFESDHSPISILCSLKARKKRKKTRLYRFEELWLQDEDCEEVVAAAWSHTRGPANRRILATGENLKIWGENRFGNPFIQVVALKDKLKALNDHLQTEATIQE